MEIENEILLTREDICSIENIAERNPSLRNEFTSGFGKDYQSVIKISPKKGLIFIKGNDYTGFDHIHLRHEFWSTAPYWINKGENVIDPSRFKRSSKTVFDYVQIVDAIFDPQNLQNTKKGNPDIFDCYVGEFIDENQTKDFYVLVTYKNSKVVHTLYPKSKANNTKRSKKLKYYRGEVSIEEVHPGQIVNIKIPYKNVNNQTKYTVFIQKSSELKLEQAFIIVHDDLGSQIGFIELGERPLEEFKSLAHLQITFQHTDLRGIESYIINLDKNGK